MDLVQPRNSRQFSANATLPYVEAPQGEQPVELRSLDIQVRISGVFAETTQTLRIYNPNTRDLEGQVCFPLPDGAVVCGYALDVGGKLVDGVVVPKQEARRILEAEERKGVDPGLVEHVQGNIYRTRVYPIAANNSRTIRVTYVSDLTLDGNDAAYHLPLQHAQHLADVSLRIEIAQSPVEPILTGGIGNMALRHAHYCWVAEATLVKGTPTEDLQIRLPKLPDTFSTFEKTQNGETFFCISAKLSSPETQQQNWIPKRVGIAWDASGSRIDNIERDLSLLSALFTRWPTTRIDLVIFRDIVDGTPQTFDLGRDEGNKLLQLLRDLPYDGATQLSALNFANWAHEDTEAWFLFSDGLATVNSTLPVITGKKLVTVNSAVHCNTSLLSYLAEQSGGLHINLLRTNSEAASAQICQRVEPVAISQQLGCESTYVSNYSKRFRVIGRLIAAEGSVLCTGHGAPAEAFLLRQHEASEGFLIARAWAGIESRTVALSSGEGSDQLVMLGRTYGLVTPGTSLLVLESLAQYLEYNIEPPASLTEMRQEFHRISASRSHEKNKHENDHLNIVLQGWEARVRWWETKFDYNISKKELLAQKIAEQSDSSHLSLPEFVRSSAPRRSPADTQVYKSRSISMAEEERSTAGGSLPTEGVSTPLGSAPASIAIQPWSPDTPYLRLIQGAQGDPAYLIYLQQRKSYATSPSFFLDCGDYFLKQELPVYGLRILSNLLEQRLDDAALMRIYGWRLQQAGHLDPAVEIFERILTQRKDEPQSYRDLALALAERWERSGHPRDVIRAMELLYAVILKEWDRFPEIEIIALMELNRLIQLSKTKDILIPEQIERRLQRHLDLDVRISLSWDADLTDVDLHVFEPSGEHAYYGHKQTEMGGLVSRDFTQGYGPEEYVIKRAMPGKYIIKAHYYGSHQQTLCGPCTVTATVFTNFGRATEKKQTLTLRLDKPHSEVVVGEITIDGGMSPESPASDSLEKFRLLRKDMSVDDVVQLLGAPTQITGTTQLLMIYKPNAVIEVQLKMAPLLISAQQITCDTVLNLVGS